MRFFTSVFVTTLKTWHLSEIGAELFHRIADSAHKETAAGMVVSYDKGEGVVGAENRIAAH